jgi:gliding motility-associated-like protein
MKVHTLLILFFTISFHSFSQLDTLFWFAAPEVSINSNFDRPILLRISTLNQASNVTIDQPANPTFVPINLTIPATSTQTVDLTTWIDQIENKPPNQVLNYGIRVRSSSPVTMYYEVASYSCNCNPEIFALKGQNALGTDFFIPSQNFLDNGASYSPVPYNSFDIVATTNNTIVTITPSQNIVGHTANVPFTITLNKGETYSATATSTLANLHLSGSRVTSTLPIAITIKDDLLAGTPFGGCADLGGDQSIPLSIIGKEYIIVRGFLNAPYDQVFVLATQNNTTVSVNGTIVTTLNAGQTYNYAIGAANSAYIVASNPVYVLQMSGFGCEIGMSVLPPIICTGSKNVSFARSTAESLFLILLVEAGGEGNFTLNGATGTINSSNFNFVPGTNNAWMFAQITIPTTTVAATATGIVSNSTNYFHMGIIHGSAGGGCRYGYFSDFAKLQYEIQSDDQTLCQGQSIDLATNTLPGATYNWTGPNNYSGTGSSISILNAQTLNSGQYIVTGNLPDACLLLPDTVNVTVIASPAAPIIYTNGPVCNGDSVAFWHNLPASNNFTWTNVLGDTLIENDSIYVQSPLGNVTVNLVSNNNGCISSIGTLTTQVIENPIVLYTGDTSVCGSEIDFIATVTENSLDSVNTIQWFRLPSNTSIGSGNPLLNTTSSTTPFSIENFKVEVLSDNGCFATDTFQIAFHPFPNANINYTDLCDGESISFTNTTTWNGTPNSTDVLNYQLIFGDNSNSTNPTITHVFNAIGNYSATLIATSSNSCSDTITKEITVYSIPVNTINILESCGQTLSFEAINQLGNFQINSIEWLIPGYPIVTQNSFTQTFSNGGNYIGNYTITGQNGCEFDTTFVFFVTPKVELPELIIPNIITANGDGINDEIVIDAVFEECFEYELKIFNRWGNLVYTMISSADAFKGKDEAGKELIEGTYFYHLISDQGEKHGFIQIVR